MEESRDQGCLGLVYRDLIPIKLVYFIYISSLAVIRPFLALFMYDLGLNSFQVGLLRCLEPFTSLLLSPVWGSIADKFRVRKYLLILCVIGSALFLPTILLVPSVELTEQEQGYYQLQNSSQLQEYVTDGTEQQLSKDGHHYFNIDLNKDIFPSESQLTFWMVGVISFADDAFIAGFIPLLDAHTMELIENYPGASYGGQRWTGSFAVIVFSPIAGILMDLFEAEGNKYLAPFTLFGVLMLMTSIPVQLMGDINTKTPPRSFTKELWVIFSFHTMLIFAMYVTAGMGRGIVLGFLFIFLEQLDASQLLMGLSLLVTCLIEIPCLLISRKVIQKLGYEVVICLGLLAYAIRLFMYSLLENPWFVLPIEALHGVCYGLLWPACTEYAKYIAPEGMSATLQSLTHAAYAGIGEIIGMAAGGLLYNLFGARALFQQAASVTMLMLVMLMGDTIRIYVTKPQRATQDEEQKSLLTYKDTP